MRNRLLVTLIILCVALPATADTSTSDLIAEKRSEEPWAKEATAYREIPFGASEADVSAKFGKLKCSSYALAFSVRSCTLVDKSRRLRIGDVVMSETFDFIGDRLARVEIRNGGGSGWSAPTAFAPFSAVRDAFVARYGTPTVDQTYRVKGSRDVKNRYGGLLAIEQYEFKRSLLTWEGKTAQVVLGGKIDGDELFVGSIRGPAWLEAEAAAEKKKTITDF